MRTTMDAATRFRAQRQLAAKNLPIIFAQKSIGPTASVREEGSGARDAEQYPHTYNYAASGLMRTHNYVRRKSFGAP